MYFYYFRIETTTMTAYYGCVDGGYGGPGVQYVLREHVQMYQLTILKAVETLPQWYREGVSKSTHLATTLVSQYCRFGTLCRGLSSGAVC
ncbi:hypothetical protein WP50_35590 [Lactiplantibacillus plantarum]|nr:hypothetical protein WP50_35590 [Lactiplantibacillus plantarum]